MKNGTAVLPESRQDPAVRQRIEWAAVQVFADSEFHQVTLQQIARAARCSLQTLYRYYGDEKQGSKEALLSACLHHGLEQLAERMLDHLAGIDTFRDRLSKVFWVVLDFFDRNPQMGRMMINSVYPGRWGSDTTPGQQRLTELFLSVLREGQEQGILNSQVATPILLDFFYGVLLRISQMHLLRGRPGRMADQHGVLFDMLWRAITV
ncbi:MULTISPECIES: TetR/AcrR family transcriptional regulator [unclassified Alcanivorax]|uniref:TetR/AcrR family transcriptional regulator n=1 Tax=unclassified Alcanivorax TaxID=2638842 RepID=UPI000789D0A4|nr:MULTISPECIES: TetR/AcrR family transcriptional regulator [unclassified Alcanivorax]KZX74967.1 TetR family transcriptional regulator [Alcanivorax sp. HI0013]KZX75282.1 TetR family transcriptional regulator [Alcanivorax sp. HI0011]KZY13189.1 TetR family transcriptional regulator [Alcanivorax sp. HI0035]MEE2603508.1 TetR/AcrR family transcriptional regulator [Pseudomonadota bacterium]KZX63098.1 TetR family transcriptional regulator [Alcanivorax sp. HI0003]